MQDTPNLAPRATLNLLCFNEQQVAVCICTYMYVYAAPRDRERLLAEAGCGAGFTADPGHNSEASLWDESRGRLLGHERIWPAQAPQLGVWTHPGPPLRVHLEELARLRWLPAASHIPPRHPSPQLCDYKKTGWDGLGLRPICEHHPQKHLPSSRSYWELATETAPLVRVAGLQEGVLQDSGEGGGCDLQPGGGST